MGKWAITDALPAFLDTLAAAANVLNEALIALQPLWQWLWDNMLLPAAEWTGNALLDFLGWLTDRLNDIAVWIKENPEKFQQIAGFIAYLAAAFWLVNAAITIWTVIASVATVVTGAFAAVMAFLTSPIAAIIAGIILLIAIIVLLITHWDWVKKTATDAWTAITQLWIIAGWWFYTNVSKPIKDAFKSVLDWLPRAWETAFTGVKNFTKNTVNTIIDFINGMIRAVAGGINAVIGGINSISVTIPSWVPVYGGSSWGLNVPTVSAPQIPRLATGAVIPANSAFAAILGDQKSGRNIEAPEALIRQIVREEAGQGGQEITIKFAGSMASLVRLLKPEIDKENSRIGGSLIQIKGAAA